MHYLIEKYGTTRLAFLFIILIILPINLILQVYLIQEGYQVDQLNVFLGIATTAVSAGQVTNKIQKEKTKRGEKYADNTTKRFEK